jgi:nitrate/nitrite-specific signal transduction histidine kinase
VAVYRTVAEAITNARRHAAASAIDVGLSSPAQRAECPGGTLKVEPAWPKETHLHLELPAGEETRT